MSTPIEKTKHISGRKTRTDKTLGTAKHCQVKSSITREQFHALVKKAAQPIVNESGSASAETSESHPSDDCNGKNTH